MHKGDCSYMVDTATVFFDYLRIEGWFHSPTDELAEVSLYGPSLKGVKGRVGLNHGGVEKDLGPNRGFMIQTLLEERQHPNDLILEFGTRNGKTIKVNMFDLCLERKKSSSGRTLLDRFIREINDNEGARLLDLGGRARSGVERRTMFPKAECTVLDILPGQGVDIVGDAHAMSALFPPNSFDAIFSVSVFEHLLMPWVVAMEMNAVLKPGGLAFLFTHQTIGMHDQPWDFWRFSDTAWEGLFNRNTGFEILGRTLDDPQYITPHLWSPERGQYLERAVGFLGSSVLLRKVAEPLGQWESVEVEKLIHTSYPDTEEKKPEWPARRKLRPWWNFLFTSWSK